MFGANIGVSLYAGNHRKGVAVSYTDMSVDTLFMEEPDSSMANVPVDRTAGTR